MINRERLLELKGFDRVVDYDAVDRLITHAANEGKRSTGIDVDVSEVACLVKHYEDKGYVCRVSFDEFGCTVRIFW